MDARAPTILVVDDDQDVLDVLKDHLTLEGFNVVTAVNGVEAFIQVRRRTPRAVILDVFMPQLGGLGALERIRQFDPGIAVILLSGFPNFLQVVQEAGLSVAGAFAKPVDLARLSEALARAGVVARDTSERVPAPDLPLEPQLWAGRRILVVDEEPDVLIGFLQGKGYETIGVQSGEEALRQIPALCPKIVLLSTRLPGLSGVETLRRIKALPHRTCVVMVATEEDEEVALQALAVGAADYVRKPVDLEDLHVVLKTRILLAPMDPQSQ